DWKCEPRQERSHGVSVRQPFSDVRCIHHCDRAARRVSLHLGQVDICQTRATRAISVVAPCEPRRWLICTARDGDAASCAAPASRDRSPIIGAIDPDRTRRIKWNPLLAIRANHTYVVTSVAALDSKLANHP